MRMHFSFGHRCASLRVRWLVLLTCLWGSACASGPVLEPTYPLRSGEEGDGRAAAATVAGVRLLAKVGAWQGRPARLDGVVPLEVTIENGGSRPVTVRYNRFALITPGGERLAALPPFDLRAAESEVVPITNPAPSSGEPAAGFEIAPYQKRFLERYPVFQGTFSEDMQYFESYHAELRLQDLPSPDMMKAALPEGVLAPGGRISGFLYLQPPPATAESVVFEFSLAEVPGSTSSFGRINIPFRIRR